MPLWTIVHMLMVIAGPPMAPLFWGFVLRLQKDIINPLSSWTVFCECWVYGAIGLVVAIIIFGPRLPWLLFGVTHVGVAGFFWWLSRRRRKRTPRSYGAKSRALIAALVRKARESARPHPAPYPGAA